ncbi:thiazole biosynthesis protein ThiJ [Synergistales bacterium]|nr:thiazole biosynthesis protein ThiJ [Synergistales bacterium]GHV55724.1 thiazole biosynthesis protein ThiJ [Synergistales bacterium]
MAKAALFLTDGFEETEALCTTDILRRGGVDLVTVSLVSGNTVTGKHGVVVQADRAFSEITATQFDMLVIPGGTLAFTEHEGLLELVRKQNIGGGKLAAICAAPAVFAKLGLLHGKRAVIYPGMEEYLKGAAKVSDLVVTDGNITTSKGPGTTVHFALRLVEILCGEGKAKEVADAFVAQI